MNLRLVTLSRKDLEILLNEKENYMLNNIVIHLHGHLTATDNYEPIGQRTLIENGIGLLWPPNIFFLIIK